ncbi:MAG TPA: Ig-like domain-containing protein [Chryseolinea sp.]|nr:Ig-like domain-containing protein [Chryseolinea sp.]
MNRLIFTLLFLVCFNSIMAADYYVSTSGNDASGNGSQGSPWRTLRFACTKVAANQGHTIRLSSGTYVEQQINVPTGVNVIGAGRDLTIIKSDPSFYYNPASPGFATDKLLMNVSSGSMTAGNQSIKDFTIDGDGKKLHGGIFLKNRSNVTIQGVKIQYTNFTGLWLWDVNDSRITDVQLKNCSWGSSSWCSGALAVANLLRVEIDHVSIDEGVGYGVKALGTTGPMHYVKFHDNNVSVVPTGAWSGGSAPNIAFELWNVDMKGSEIYNNFFDNTVSLIMDQPQWATPKGIQTIRVYNNVLDMEKRAGGNGYALEVSMHDIEIDHNHIHKGKYAIANWDTHGTKMSNWSIHHNTFYGIVNSYPGDIVRAQNTGFHNVKFYNNTVEFVGTGTTNLVASYGGTSENVEIKNNLIINSATAYNWYPNKLVYLENATLSNLQVVNNFLVNQAVGTVPGTYTNNITTGDPKITKSGNRPSPYYVPAAGSPLIDAGLSLGLSFSGTKPDIGAYESGSSASTIAVTGVTVTPSAASLSVNGTTQLTTTVSPSNATNKNLTWTSSNAAVATVNNNGLVTAIAAGTTTITAKTVDGNKTAACNVTVTTSTVAVAGLTIAPTTLSVGINGTAQLAKTIAPSNATNQNVNWSSSNVAVATVSNTGLVTGKAAGNATITGTTADGNKTATASVTVSSSQVLAVDLDNASHGTAINKFNFGSGWTHAANTADPFFMSTASFSNTSSNAVTLQFSGNKVELYTAKASHHGIAAVSIDGGTETYVDLYSASRQDYVSVYNSVLADGNHTIKIRVTGTKNSAATGTYVIVDFIKVYSLSGTAVTGVAVAPATVTIGPGSTQQLTATVSPSAATNKNVTWTSSNNSVATVSSTGLITGVAAGAATITAKTVDGEKINTSSVSVTSSVSSVAISPSSIAVNLGATHQLNAVVTPSTATNKNLTWRSANNTIATVSPTGVVTAVAVGNVAITATSEDGGKVSTCNFSVIIPVTGVTINPTTLSLNTGATQAMNAIITPANATNKNVTWSSSNPAVAIVNNNGTLTAVAPGVATITVTTADGNKTATSSVTVKLQQDFIELDDATIGTSMNQFKYTGSAWTNAANTGDTYFNKTCSHSNTTNHYATLSFTGNKVEYFSSKASHHGIVAVSIDGGPETMVDLYAASRQDYAMVFSSGTLTEGTHNIKIRVTGGRNSSSSASYVIIDYLKVFSSTTVATTSTENVTSSLFNEGASNETQIYPNPVASGDILHVRLVEAAGVVSVIDVTGYAHYTAAPTSVDLEIPTSSMPKGMYFVQHKIGGSQVQYKILVD